VAEPMYGSSDGEPFAYTPGEAWVVREGSKGWSRADSSEIGVGGRVLSKAASFDAKFPSLPPLPSNAFHSGVGQVGL
jgi:hypothetical protein